MPEAVIYSYTVEGHLQKHVIGHPEIHFKCMLCNKLKCLLEESFANIIKAKAKTEPEGLRLEAISGGWLL